MTARAPTAATPALSFNLWSEPWITVLDASSDRRPARLGIRDCLAHAHTLFALTDPSPLVIAGVQRLLAAIAQDIFRPRGVSELAALLRRGRFDPDAVDRFGDAFSHRFDLFSEAAPFLQTADVPRELPRRTGETKPVSYLFPDEPTATNINHFAHRYDRDAQYAPATAAAGLVTLAAFATSGGAGIKPSINGVPPLYVLPAGTSIFETLARSIVTTGFRPRIASTQDHPAWARDPVIRRGHEVLEVGYLESLTFPARRVRLIPERVAGRCSRSGDESPVLVRRMVFEMGHARPKQAQLWLDPFAAYRTREKEAPVPVRPQQGKALWREYGTLFQTVAPDESLELKQAGTVIPPGVVQQLAALGDTLGDARPLWQFRCIGLRTDMKAKVFEWVDETLDVPGGILADPASQAEVTAAVQRAEDWARRIAAIHRGVYAGGEDALDGLRARMLSRYWILLAEPFRTFVLDAADRAQREDALRDWTTRILRVGEDVLTDAADSAGDRGNRLRQRAELLTRYRIARAGQAKGWLP